MHGKSAVGSGAASSEEDSVTRETDAFLAELSLRGVEVTPISDADLCDLLPRSDGRSAYLVGRSLISLSEGVDCSTDAGALALGRALLEFVEVHPLHSLSVTLPAALAALKTVWDSESVLSRPLSE